MSTTDFPSNRTLHLERTLKAPIALVWEAWSQAEHIVKWWGPKSMDTKIVAHNFVEGGNWHYVMTMPNGNAFVAEGTYKEIVALEKIVTTANFRPMTENVVLHALFSPRGEHTLFSFYVVHETEDYCKQQEAMGFYNGWASTFDRLEALLTL